jgi:hypothetical protein
MSLIAHVCHVMYVAVVMLSKCLTWEGIAIGVILYNVLQIGGRFNAANVLLADVILSLLSVGDRKYNN